MAALGKGCYCIRADLRRVGRRIFFLAWHYFGYPLPNPFYLKGDGHLYPHSMIQSMVNVSLMLRPFCPFFARLSLQTLAPQNGRRAYTGSLLHVRVGAAERLEQSLHALPVCDRSGGAAECARTADGVPKGISLPKWETLHGLQRAALRVALGFALVVAVGYFDRIIPYISAGDGMRTFALRLAPYAGKGYTMAVTEAGQLPLYSDWRVIDGLGLNDAWLAHHGERLTEEYLDRSKPEIIMVHASFPGSAESMKAMLYGDLYHAG